ncbi:MAG: conjugal transfer protein TraX [Erysipelotrichaceae bacterium]|nr:conjugal transfer protein TraX [Erysipelotrichaceae bacterium]
MTKRSIVSSSTLHILAMLCMLCDHLWATIIPGNQWLTSVGRIAYPIFAFMVVEGYFHTSNLRKYATRLLVFAIISEIPFNLMYSNSLFYPLHQNVIWTLLIGLAMIHLNESVRNKKIWVRGLVAIASIVIGGLLGIVLFTDYNSVGVWTILVFYFFRGKKWWSLVGQLLCLYYLNVEILKGLYFEVEFLGMSFEVVQQGLALVALIPIWVYDGSKGIRDKWFKYLCYWFYPVHMLVLWGIYRAM